MKKIKKSTLVILCLLALFIIFQLFTIGGIRVSDIERWWSDNSTEKFIGSFKPKVSFGITANKKTIIPLVWSIYTARPRDTISLAKATSAYGYDYERFEYV